MTDQYSTEDRIIFISCCLVFALLWPLLVGIGIWERLVGHE